MAIFDDDSRPKRPVHEIGADLGLLSVEELGDRIASLREEIVRLEEERQRKSASRAAAESFFR